MKPGDTIVCLGTHGYKFTEGKEYTVLTYEPAEMSDLPGFTWPAYVRVLDDNGKRAICHARRFILKEST